MSERRAARATRAARAGAGATAGWDDAAAAATDEGAAARTGGPAEGDDPAGPGRRVRRRRPLLVALLATLGTLLGIATVVAVVAGVFIGGLARSFDDHTTTIDDAFPDGPRPVATGRAQDILLIGSDSRAAYDPSGDGVGGGRADTLMLVHLPADRQAAYLMSIMRDSWVDVPGHGRAKINAAYSWGGVPLVVQTVEQLLDTRIDHVAEIDFAGFRDLTDALGGVTVQVPQAFTARGHTFAAGADRLDGDAALAFVRERYAFADADHTRVRNQQAFMRGVADGLLSRGTLTNPGRVQDVVTATSRYLSVDPGLDFRTLVGLGWSLRDVRPSDLVTFTMPTAGGGTSADGQSYVTVNTLAVQSLAQALRSDDLPGWLRDNPQ